MRTVRGAGALQIRQFAWNFIASIANEWMAAMERKGVAVVPLSNPEISRDLR